jgi:hypothetical protein
MRGDREFIPSLNPRSSVASWEVSPCLEFNDIHDGQPEIEAFDTVEEAEQQGDEANGPVFWGVYARMNEEAIASGHAPAIHLMDFQCHADAVGFVQLLNGKEDDDANIDAK